MPDPRVLSLEALEFYQRPLMPQFYKTLTPPVEGWPPRDSPQGIQKSMTKAHDNVRLLVAVNDRLRRDQLGLIEVVKIERRWRKLTMGAFGLTWTLLLYLGKELLPYILKGMSH